MKRRIHRLFSLILSLVLVVGLFPGTIIATAETQNGGGFIISGDTESWNMKLSDTGVLTWDAQAGATGYSIRFFLYANGTGSLTHISGLTEPSCDLKAWFEKYKIESGGYLFNITAIGVGESPDISVSYVSTLPKLSEPQNVKWNGTKATWDSVSNATGYRVSLYFDNYAAGASEVVTGTEYDFGTSVTDGCWVKVKAIADGYRNSNEAESEKYGTAAVSCGGFDIGEDTSAWNISISDAGVLTWNPQAGATGYSIRFFVYADGSGALTIIQGLTEPSCDLKAWFEKYKIESGSYLFNITAIDAGESPDISVSYVSTLPKLSEPQNVNWNGTKATWDSVSNATGYRVSLYHNDYAAGTSEVVTGTEYDFGTSVTDGCWVKVKALADGYRNSNEAEGPKYSVGSVPVTYMITVTNGKATVGGTEITKAAEGEKVTITANAAPDGQVFDKWVVESGSVTLASESNETTFFTMPAGEVSVKATYKKDISSVKNIDVTITAPQIGQTPDYDPVIDADPANSVEFQEATWYKVAEDSYTGTDEDSWIEVMADEEFTAGYYYSVDLFLNTTGDNKMTYATTGTINGMPHDDTYGGIFNSDTSAYLCGVFEPIHEHIPGADWVNDSEKHWHVCYCGEDCEEAEHTAGDWIIDAAATAEADGSKHKECTVCGYIMETETIPATGEEHTHSFDDEWKTNDEKHWHECSCGEKSDEEEHSFKWVVDKEATSTEKGSKHEECEACGYKRAAVEIPATGSETDPTKPTTPTTPTKPTNPSNSNESGKTTETAKTDNPATGENGVTALWIALIIASGFGFAATDAYRKKRKSLK